MYKIKNTSSCSLRSHKAAKIEKLCGLHPTLLIFLFLLAFSSTAFATPGIIVYTNATVSQTTLQYRIWNGVGFGAQTSTGIGVGVIRWLKVVTNPIRNEAIMGSLDASGDIIFAVYNATADTWG